MTSGLQPINAGAPQPVQGVTGGPGINSGTASVDPGSGALVFHPQPANVVQVRGSTPGAFQVYEYFHTNTDFSRLSLNAQAGGPFQLAVETDPTTVIRDLDINTGGNLVVNATNTNITQALNVTGNAAFSGLVGVGIAATASIRETIVGLGSTNATNALVVRNGSQTLNLIIARDDGVVTIGNGGQILVGNVAGALGFFGSGGSPKLSVTGAKGGNVALGSLMTALAAYGLVTDGTTA